MKLSKKLFVSLVTVLLFYLTACEKQPDNTQVDDSPSPAPVIEMNKSNFSQHIKDGVVLVDFWATWCRPCKIQGPIVEGVARRVEGEARVGKLNVEKAPDITQKFDVENIPTLIIFQDGQPVERFVGVTGGDKLVRAIRASTESQ